MIYKDKIAVITGSTGGLGEAIARKLAEEGAGGLIVTGRNEQRGQKVAAELNEMGSKTVFVRAELSDPKQCRNIIRAVDTHFNGIIHGLVNSAAYTARGTIEDTSLEEWDKQFAVNIRAPFLLIQEAVRRMQKEKIAGSIVNIGSIVAYSGQPFLTPYAATKGALMTLTKNVANSQRFHRIRCNAVQPGWMDTPAEHMIQKTFHNADDNWLEKAEAGRPFGKLIKPEEVADLVALILSDKGGVMTGAIIDYDQLVITGSD